MQTELFQMVYKYIHVSQSDKERKSVKKDKEKKKYDLDCITTAFSHLYI